MAKTSKTKKKIGKKDIVVKTTLSADQLLKMALNTKVKSEKK